MSPASRAALVADALVEPAVELAMRIHAQKRRSFDMGPAPFAYVLDVSHKASGSRWELRISRHIPMSGVHAVVALLQSAGAHDDPEDMAKALAFVEAANQLTAADAGGAS